MARLPNPGNADDDWQAHMGRRTPTAVLAGALVMVMVTFALALERTRHLTGAARSESKRATGGERCGGAVPHLWQ
jgi:hypothetical protein